MVDAWYDDGRIHVFHGDCLDVLRGLPDCSVDAVVTDPPYGLAELKPETVAATLAAWLSGDREYVPGGRGGFMGASWDSFVPPVAVWDEALRVLKPGGHLAAFAGSRTYDLMGLAVRLAGFEVRDGIACWVHGQGFPKSRDVSRDIDRMAGVQREIVGTARGGAALKIGGTNSRPWHDRQAERGGEYDITAPATDEARRWEGFGTALKPSNEPIILARRPLTGTVAATVLEWGTGALNIDATRVRTGDTLVRPPIQRRTNDVLGAGLGVGTQDEPPGRWPSNVVLSHVPLLDADGVVVGDACADGCVEGCAVAELDAQSGVTKSTIRKPTGRDTRGIPNGSTPVTRFADTIERGSEDEGGASRYFPTFRYEAKADTESRPRVGGVAHPTVKPVSLMQWLVRLITPPGGTCLDMFAGSGTTGEACQAEGFPCILIEREADYLPLIEQRLTKRSDPVKHLESKGEDMGLFELL